MTHPAAPLIRAAAFTDALESGRFGRDTSQ